MRETSQILVPPEMAAIEAARSFLFTPASSERMLAKAAASEADAVVVDFEDGVAPNAKQIARENYAAKHAVLAAGSPTLLARINGDDSPEYEADVAVLDEFPPVGVVIPKATFASIEAAAALGLPLIAAIETAQGIVDIERICLHPAVVSVTFGAADLAVELGLIEREDRAELLMLRSRLVVASALAGLRHPIDCVFLDVRDTGRLVEESRYARSLGFSGKACIHPDQVGPVNAAFSPTDSEMAWAQRVVDAFGSGTSAGTGSVEVDGRLVDLPVAITARRILSRAHGRNEPEEARS